jgi:hypothetical protein
MSVGQVSRTFLLTPLPEDTPLREHIHPHLTIVINGQVQAIPAGIGIGPKGFLPLHTHDASGTIHVESPGIRPFRLGDFFKVWGQSFTRRQILGHRASSHHPITMTVNGHPSSAFGSLLLRDAQDIVIRA